MNRTDALTALQALANDARLDLVRLLMPAGTAGLSAGDIGRALGLSASRLSFHLSALEQAHLIRARKEGRHVYYAVDPGGIGQTTAKLRETLVGIQTGRIADTHGWVMRV